MENSTSPTLKRILGAFATGLFLLADISTAVSQTAALVPNARQQFFNSNGQPLAGGSATFYVPNTTTPKSIWLDENEATLSANPVTLDSGGFATIFGQGNYREIVKDASNNLIFDGFTSAYGASTPSGATGSDTAPVGTILPWAGFNFNVPTNWALAYGQALSRTTYAQLFAAITISTLTGNCTATSVTVSGFADTSQMAVGSPIEATCLPSGDTVASIVNGTTITVAVAATATTSTTVTVFPWGNGDGVSTFNVPDLRGRVAPGADAMGGSAAGRLTSAHYGSGASTPALVGGAQSETISPTIAQANLPNVNFTVSGITLSNPSLLINGAGATGGCLLASGCTAGAQSDFVVTNVGSTSIGQVTSSVTVSAQGSAASGGSGTALASTFTTVQPSITMDYIIKIAPNTTGAGGVVSVNGLFGDVLWLAGSGLSVTTSSPNITYACNVGSSSIPGCLQVDGTTITASGGVISAVGASQGITIGTTTVSGGSNGDILSVSSGTLAQAATTGSGNVVLASSPTLVTPALGAASGTSLALGGATLGGAALAVTGGATLNSALTYGGVTLSNAVTGTGSMVLSAAPTLTGTVTLATLAATTINGAALSGTFSGNPTLSGVPVLSGLSSGTCVSGLSLDSGNHVVTSACPGTATSIQPGITTITSGTNHSVLTTGSGTLAQAGPGTAGQALVSNGSSAEPTFQSGQWVHLATLTASSSSALNDATACGGANCLTSKYNEYELVFTNIVPATNAVTPELFVHSGGSYPVTGYVGQSVDALSTTSGGQTATTFINLGLATDTFNGAPGLNGSIRVRSPSVSAIHPWFGTFSQAVTSSTAAAFVATGYWNTAGAIDGFQFAFSSGNITSGTIDIYGRL